LKAINCEVHFTIFVRDCECDCEFEKKKTTTTKMWLVTGDWGSVLLSNISIKMSTLKRCQLTIKTKNWNPTELNSNWTLERMMDEAGWSAAGGEGGVVVSVCALTRAPHDRNHVIYPDTHICIYTNMYKYMYICICIYASDRQPICLDCKLVLGRSRKHNAHKCNNNNNNSNSNKNKLQQSHVINTASAAPLLLCLLSLLLWLWLEQKQNKYI